MQTVLTRRITLDVPLIQAPMAGVSTPEMAAAVSNAGGLGSVALGALNADQAAAALRRTRALTNRPIAANVFTHPTPKRDRVKEAEFLAALAPLFAAAGAPPPDALTEIYRSFNDDDALLEVLLEAKPEVVSLHFGPAIPSRMQALKSVGCYVMATATSVAEAKLLADSGVDALVLQGYDAGGHSGAFLGGPDPRSAGRNGLRWLLNSVRGSVDVPVIAAGGLMDGADVREVLEAGAAAAQLGTAFIDCVESSASPAYRAALTSGVGTRLTARISGRPARGMVNSLLAALETLPLDPPVYPIAYDAVKQLVGARADPGFAVMWAGSEAARSRSGPCAERVAAIRAELEAGASGSV